MELDQYLQKELSLATAERYRKDIDFFFFLLNGGQAHLNGGQALEANPIKADYRQIMEVMKQLRERYENPKTINRILAAIKKYYDYLLYTNQREDHPCRNLRLKDAKRGDIQLQDLFTERELELLLSSSPARYKSYKTDKTRNKLILSFLIYQGLTREETARIKTDDINLEKGEIYIPGHAQQNSRTLPLKASQIHFIYQYLDKRKPGNGQLFMGQRGEPLSGDAICRLVDGYKYLFPDKQLSCSTIRMSVCRNLLKSGKDLRAVQVYMGHKYPSSTERYKTSNTEELKQAIRKYHPLR